jgi:hypothetical protein
MMDYKDFVGLFLAAAGAILVVGFAVLTIAEIFLLKKKGWIDEKLSLRYPIITNLVNIPVAAIAYVVIVWILFVVAFMVMGAIEFNYRKDYPDLVDAAGIVFYVFAFILTFLGYSLAFSLVRLLTTNIMARSSGLTWKYTVGQSALLAILMMIVSFLLTATLYM